MDTIKNASKLLRVIWKDNWKNGLSKFFGKRKRQINIDKPIVDSKVKKLVGGFFGVIALLFLLAYISFYSIMLTEGSINSGVFEELIFMFMAMAQLIVIFFGSLIVINNFYFSKDNLLLATLPISSKSIFLAKFTTSYLSQLLIAGFIYLPFVIASGVYAKIIGYDIGAEFFIIGTINVFFIPIFPLLIITLLSFPIMYIVTLVKKRSLATFFGVFLLVAFSVGIYIGFISLMTQMGSTVDEQDNLFMPASMISVLMGLKKATIFNYLIINAMLGKHIVGFFFAHIVGLLGLLVVTMLISSVFYRKGMVLALESGQKLESKKTKISYKSNKFVASFVKKELKQILGVPSLLVSPLMSIVMLPVLGVIFGKSMEGTSMMNVGMILNIGFIFISSSNILSLIGVSLEGKNIYLLKTLPISAKDILVPKIIVANILNILVALSASITLGILVNENGILVGILCFIVLVIGGIGGSCYGLYNDIKNPNFNYKNINELTKNNRRAIKPALIGFMLGIIFIVLGVVVSSINFTNGLSYLIMFGGGGLVTSIFAIVSYRKLIKNANIYYDNLEV